MSMPSTGFYLFLRYINIITRRTLLCVNALNGLLLISSRMKDVELPKESVSMPSTGFYSFLPSHGYLGRKHRYHKCQCPQRASTHFFKGWKVAMGNWKLCQCPQRASTHFFSYERCRTSKRKCVNALNGLLLISSVIGGTTEKNPFCVNALNGLLLISSYFTGWKAE